MRKVEMAKNEEPKKKRVVRRKKSVVTADQIAERAYFLHLAGGSDPLHNWLTAERELVG
jgi:hypothetical protein